MFIRGIPLFLMACATISVSGTWAGAQQRNPAQPPEASSSGPPIIRHIPGLRILFGEDFVQEEASGNRSGNAEDIDESYYEPQPAQPQKPKKNTAVTPQKPVASGSESPAAAEQKAAAAAKPAAPGLTCEKAATVISGYGFSDVSPESCAGKTYAFAAKRDGRSFAIKVDAASGELSEVKKLP